MPIFNVMEEIVRNALMEHMEQLRLPCTCERCIDDVMALSLNHLPPKYIVNEGASPIVRAYYTADRQGAANIISILFQAAETVSKNQRCSNRVD
ncbi:late competence development ComFB family protein [Bacillus sp. Gen3]|uniref:Late competence development ComFB family protein n=1 Tax=Heyndrickxia oleronia TaxID=38875 RepID=A0AAW6SZ87_9BACI|nr:late competence development ComFB family protein [Heyndrickxia oleronia]MDH5161301.1 late competence development ComFB family protein [Heyndrickxia oleronia]NYV66228.1 late competence development ComFB family protein [Bacillus sp. Gen3]GIN39711.1 ComF operon protein 2 [Heyndrickxia oleronia]